MNMRWGRGAAGPALVALLVLSGGCGEKGRVAEPADEPGARGRTAAAEAERARIRLFWSHANSGARLRTEGKAAEAIVEFQLALAIDPKHEDSLYGLGNAFLDLGREDEALDAYRRLVAANPNSARGELQLGALAVDPASPHFDPSAALAAFEAAHRINAEETGALIGMAEALLLLGDEPGARRKVDEVLVTHSQSRPARFLRGYFRSRSGDRPGAADDLTGAVGERLAVKARRDDIPSEGDTKRGSAALGGTSETRIRGLVAVTLDGLLAEKRGGGKLDVDATYRTFAEKFGAARANAKRRNAS